MPTFCEPCPGNRNASLPISRPPQERVLTAPSEYPTRAPEYLARHDRQKQARRPHRVVEDRLSRRPRITGPVDPKRMTRVGVPVEAREGAARDQHPDAVPSEKDVARRTEID